MRLLDTVQMNKNHSRKSAVAASALLVRIMCCDRSRRMTRDFCRGKDLKANR